MPKKMQMKMLRCDGQWFLNQEELVRHFEGYFPPAPVDSGLSALKDIEEGKYKPVPQAGDLPPVFRLTDKYKMPPVYDQASRGTCVAQAATALMEYYCGCQWRFSMQYLFERIKRLEAEKKEKTELELKRGEAVSDPTMAKKVSLLVEVCRTMHVEPAPEIIIRMLYSERVTMEDGSNCRLAMETLAKWGICTYEKWPYSRHILHATAEVDVARPDMPPGADEEAALHRLLAPYYIFPAPNNVEEIKRYLVGMEGRRPMPVMIGVCCLGDTSLGVMPLEDGFIRLPKVRQWEVESALCTVTPILDGEGKRAGFRVEGCDERTVKKEFSLNTMDMSKTGGHAMLIVGYQDDEGVPGGGYFIVRNSWNQAWGKEGYCNMSYAYLELFVLEAATVLQPLAHVDGGVGAPAVPPDLREYVVKAERDWSDRHEQWTIEKGDWMIVDQDGAAEKYTEEAARRFRRNGFTWKAPVAETPAPEKSAAPAAMPPEVECFFRGVEAGFRQLPLEFPQLGGLRRGWLFGVGKATSFEQEAGLSKEFGEGWLRLYRVDGAKGCFRIAAAYIPDAGRAAEAASRLRAALEKFAAAHPYAVCNCTIAVLACAGDIPKETVPPYLSENEVRLVLDHYTPEAGWRLAAPALPGDRAWPEWLLRLTPNTPAQWEHQLDCAYDDVQKPVYAAVKAIGGQVSLAELAKKAGLQEELVRAAIAKGAGLRLKGEQVAKK